MRRSASVLAILSLACISALAQGNYAARRIIGRLNDAALAARGGAAGHGALDDLALKYGRPSIRSLVPGKAPVAGGIDPAGLVALEFDRDVDIPSVIADYLKTGMFRYLEPDYIGHAGSGAPNDAFYGRQWSLKNDGTFPLSPAKAGADMGMEIAWQMETGDSNVIVAILDTGCKLDHEELAGRIWHNPKDGTNNGVDDDADGYVDDSNGWNFALENSRPIDSSGHGTNVAGIIGANGGNGVGYAGVDWHCKLMIGKVIADNGFGYYSWWISGIMYAVHNGARVINMSLGGDEASQGMQEAVDYAYARNVTIVAAMGNDNYGLPAYPAALRHVIAVGSTDPNDTRSAPFFWSPTSGSNYGGHISVMAPGNYIYGLGRLPNDNFNFYWGGTSQAAPHVSGLAALLIAQKPGRTVDQIRAIIEGTADDLVGNPAEDTRGFDPYYGHGRINAGKALCQDPPPLIPEVIVKGTLPLKPGDSVVLDAGSYSAYLWSNGATTRTIAVRSPGTYSVRVTNVCGMTATAPGVTVMPDGPFLVEQPACRSATDGAISNLSAVADRSQGAITVRADLSRRGTARLRITDVAGRELVAISDERLSGAYERVVSGAGLPAGVYFITLAVGGSGRTVKLVMK
ncbi:MAG: type sorting protein [Chlorobi bacterium]|nr:type sorting protein [Chlorobiota bacterium]